MKRRPVLLLLSRMAGVYLLAAACVFAAPSTWPKLISPLIATVADWSCPYLNALVASAADGMIEVRGQIHVDMTSVSGSPVPDMPGVWHKHSGPTLNILTIAVALWAAPCVDHRRRIAALPVMLLATALVSSVDLAAETQATALHAIGTEWLPRTPMAPTEANKAAFQRLEAWYRSVMWFKAFNEGGGRLFLAVLAGLVGYAIPISRESQAEDQTPKAQG